MGWTGAINTQVRATKSCWNFSQRTHPIYLIVPQTHVLVHFRLFHYCTNFGAKWAQLLQLVHKFMQWSRVRIIRIERTRSTLLHSNSCFGAFRTVSLLHKLRCKMCGTGTINVQVRAMKSRQNLSHRTQPIHPIALKLMFGAFWIVSLLHELRCKTGRTCAINAQVRATKSYRNFSQWTRRSTPFEPKLMFWGISNHFVTAWTVVQNGPNLCD
jgi:hypothetical protein